jgi:hypothetical protein
MVEDPSHLICNTVTVGLRFPDILKEHSAFSFKGKEVIQTLESTNTIMKHHMPDNKWFHEDTNYTHHNTRIYILPTFKNFQFNNLCFMVSIFNDSFSHTPFLHFVISRHYIVCLITRHY